MPATAAKLDLFARGADGALLSATRCRQCAYVDVPPQTYGCRRCGAHGEDLAPEQIPAHGTVLAAATVHRHPDPAVPMPFTVAVVALAVGPVVRVIIRDGEPVAVGDGVRGELVADDDGTTDLRFTRCDAR